ncbi:MAG TPA: PAS domain S-box protein [Trebonia sp.]|nr:PAS domain S-box protein [Trebonia sp.]
MASIPESALTRARQAIGDLEAQLGKAREDAARLTAIVEWSDDAMFAIDTDAIIATWNPGAERLLGYAPAEIIGRPATVLLPFPVSNLRRFLERTAAGEIAAGHDVRCLRQDGSVVDVAVTCAAMRDADGTVTGFSVVLRDITRRLEAQAELAAARAEREVQAERERMARDLHDRVIQRIFAAGMALQNAARMARNPQATERIGAVVRDLDLTIDELRATIFTLRRDQRRDGGLRYSVLLVIEETAAALGFSPEVTMQGAVDSVPEDLAAEVLAVCREALSNVVRHARATEAAVFISAGEELLLRVTDNGRGMGTPTWIGGLGSMRQRAETRGGTFVAGSAPGAGTRVQWRVPIPRGAVPGED